MSNILPWENEEEQNYSCIRKIVTDIASEGLRKIFKQEWDSRYQTKIGAWDDTNVSGQQLYHLEKTRSSARNYLTKFQDGDTRQWDCTVLFDVILYSNSIGRISLNPTIRNEVDNLRKIRNEIMHVTEGKLSDVEFENKVTCAEISFKALGLPTNEIEQIRIEKSRYTSFKVLPPMPTHDIVYRDKMILEIVKDLDALYSTNNNKLTYFYITGNPGSGKSQLASQVCEHICSNDVNWKAKTTFVMTLNATTLDSLLYSYEDFCRRLNCDKNILVDITNSSKPVEKKVKDLRLQIARRIKNWKRWLLVIDNVEDLTKISPLLPQINEDVWGSGQVIATTQNKISIPPDSSFTRHINIGKGMNDGECRKLLSSLSKTDPHDPLLDEVSEQLDRQPLALAAAAVYRRQFVESNCQFSWRDYLKKLEQGKRKATEEHLLNINSAYSSTMTAAVLLAVEKCAESNLILKHTFRLLSLVSFEPLPLNVIVNFIQRVDDDYDREDIFLAVHKYSLFLPVNNDDGDIRLHRVVHDAIKIFCDNNVFEGNSRPQNEKTDEVSQVSVLGTVGNVVRTLYSFKDSISLLKLIPHLKAFVSAVKKRFSVNEALISISVNFGKVEISEIYIFFGKVLRKCCEYGLSLEFKNAILQIWKGWDDPIPVCGIYNQFAILHEELGELDKAEEYFWKQYQQANQSQMDVAAVLNNLGNLCSKKSEFRKAIDYCKQAKEIVINQLGPKHEIVAQTYCNLGTTYLNAGELSEAEDNIHYALEMNMELLAPDHPHVADCYNNLAGVYRMLGKLQEAKEMHEKALKIVEEKLGLNHVKVASSYENLGTLYCELGELEKGEKNLERSLEIAIQIFGPDNAKVVSAYNKLGRIHLDANQLDKSRDYAQRAIEIQESLVDANHLDLATSYSILGECHHKSRQLEDAKLYQKKALDIRKRQLGSDHLDLANSYDCLGLLYSDAGDVYTAIDYHQQSLDIRVKKCSPTDIDVATSYSNLGLAYLEAGALEKAKCSLQKAMGIFETNLPPNHILVANSWKNIGILHAKFGEWKEAINCFEKSLKIYTEKFGLNHLTVADIYANLGDVYSCVRVWNQAINFFQKALEVRLKCVHPEHVLVAISYSKLGMAYMNLGVLDNAKDSLERAMEIYEECDLNDVDFGLTCASIGKLYLELGKLKEAKVYFEKALAITTKMFGPNHVNVVEWKNLLAKLL